MRPAARQAGWRETRPLDFMLARGIEHQVFMKEKPGETAYPNGHLTVITEPSLSGFHLSISHRFHEQVGGAAVPGRYPTWDEIKEAWHLFCPRGRDFAMLFPAEEERWVNYHETTFHLWEVTTTIAMTEVPAEIRQTPELAEIDGIKERT